MKIIELIGLAIGGAVAAAIAIYAYDIYSGKNMLDELAASVGNLASNIPIVGGVYDWGVATGARNAASAINPQYSNANVTVLNNNQSPLATIQSMVQTQPYGNTPQLVVNPNTKQSGTFFPIPQSTYNLDVATASVYNPNAPIQNGSVQYPWPSGGGWKGEGYYLYEKQEAYMFTSSNLNTWVSSGGTNTGSEPYSSVAAAGTAVANVFGGPTIIASSSSSQQATPTSTWFGI